MATPQLLSLSGGAVQGVNPVQSSSGSSSAGSVVALNTNGQIDSTMLPPTNYVMAAGAATLSASQVVGSVCMASGGSVAANLAGSVGGCTTPATAAATFTLYKMAAGTNTQIAVGTVVFAPGAYSPTFTSTNGAAVTFSAGDTLQLVAPSTVDSTLAGVSVSVLCTPSVNLMSVSGGASTLPARSVVLSYCATVAGAVAGKFAGSVASCVTSATAAAVFPIYRISAGGNTQTQIGTMTFAAGAYSGTFAVTSGASLSFSVGDTLQVVAPSTADSTLSNVSLSIVGVN